MNHFSLKIDQATDFIERALNDFLRDKKLQLTNQQYEKLKKLLMVRLMDEELSYAKAYNQLSEIMEYRKDYEINANAPDEAEEEMIRIIGAADDMQVAEGFVEAVSFKKRFLVVTVLFVVLLIGLLGAYGFSYLKEKTAQNLVVVTASEEEDLKSLVSQLVDLEKQHGNEVSAASIYNKIKKLEKVQDYGVVSSYKKFNKAQYVAAVEYLKDQIEELNSNINN